MTIEPVAYFRSPVTGKFGLPRQAGIVKSLQGVVEFCPEYAREEALRGLEGFDFIWLIWGFNLNKNTDRHLTVRPPRLGGNERMGVFATRSPFRPNPLGLSSVRIREIDFENGRITVEGADLADGTPIYDVKPYVEFADSHPDVRSGFVDTDEWQELEVFIPEELAEGFSPSELESLEGILAQDPRPQYQEDPQKTYGLAFAGRNVRFIVTGGKAQVVSVE